MKRIKLTQGKYALVDNEDYEFLNQWKWHFSKDRRGYYHAVRNVWDKGKCKSVYMHRVIMNTPPGLEVDHINHDRLDNRKENLRNVTRSQNMMNQKLRSDSSSGYKGVFRIKKGNGWVARITKDNKPIYLGFYHSPEEAAQVYNQAAKRLFGEFAYAESKSIKK